MKIKSLELNTYLKTKKINKPTDFIATGKFTVVSNIVAKQYGAVFAMFLSAILTKYQSLQLSKKFANKDNFEFWYTELDSRNDIGISYYKRKKCIEEGIAMGLWQCETKYNSTFGGHINKLDHFLIDWDNIAQFFKNLQQNDKQVANADEKFIQETIEDEIQELQRDKSDEIEITNAEVEDFVNSLANQPGIKNKESYKLSLLNKYFANDKRTRQNLKLFLHGKKNLENMRSEEDYQHLLYKYFYYQNYEYYINNIQKADDNILVSASSLNDEAPPMIMKVPETQFEEFEKSTFEKEN